MAYEEGVTFSPREMSKLSHQERAGMIAAFALIGVEDGGMLVQDPITVVSVDGGGLFSRQRLSKDGKVVEWIDVRVADGKIDAQVYGQYSRITGGDLLSDASAFRYLVGIAQDLGIPVNFPEGHTPTPLR
jgi:hypothetical protein